jgi:hypothetical protein
MPHRPYNASTGNSNNFTLQVTSFPNTWSHYFSSCFSEHQSDRQAHKSAHPFACDFSAGGDPFDPCTGCSNHSPDEEFKKDANCCPGKGPHGYSIRVSEQSSNLESLSFSRDRHRTRHSSTHQQPYGYSCFLADQASNQ